MTIQTRRVSFTTFTDDEGREFELPISGPHIDDYHGPLVTDNDDGTVLVSYMVSDDDSYHLNPAEEECSGWQMFKVLDSQRDADELSSLLNDCEACGYHCTDHVDEDGNPRTDLETWIGCDGFVEPEARKALDAGRAFLFEKYEHGLVRYALRGESSAVDRQWDVSPVAGFMWADDDWGAEVDIEHAARDFLETYTDWCNGNVWGIVHVVYRPEDDTWEQVSEDSCWGYIGDDAAADVMKQEHGA
jgi:hypothetical protein